MGIPTEILWEWDGNENENFVPTATLIREDNGGTCPQWHAYEAAF